MQTKISIPVISFENFEKQQQSIADQIVNACEDVGFFYVKDVGVSFTQVQQVFEISKKFFSLSLKEKQQVAYSTTESNRGYVSLNVESLDPSRKERDAKEAFNIGNPKDKLNRYVKEVPQMQEILENFFQTCHQCALRILSAMAIGLKEKSDFFTLTHSRGDNTLRLLHYPPLQNAGIRAGEHTDYGSITLLFQDDIGGLEVLPKQSEKWIPVAPVKDAILVNIGDLMMRWTNDRFVSTKHRVITTEKNSKSSRYSIAYFCHPDEQTLVSCIDSCKSETNPARYKPIKAIDHLLEKLNKSYK